MVESTAKSLTRQGLLALDQTIAARLGGEEEAEPSAIEAGAPAVQETVVPALWPEGGSGITPVKAPAPAGAGSVSMASVGVQVLKDVTRDLAADYIPADKQEKVLYFSLGVLAMLLFVMLVRLVQRH